MARKDYPFPPDTAPTVDATDEEAAAYEQTIVRVLSEWIGQVGRDGAHGHSGVLLSVGLKGSRPNTEIAFHYRSHAGGEYDAYWPLWDDESLIVPAIGDLTPFYESPNSLASIIVANWADGSIQGNDDPYWAAVRRQEQAMADWRAAFPEALAALPTHDPEATDDERRAAWEEWARRYPEAAERRAEAWRSVEDFLE